MRRSIRDAPLIALLTVALSTALLSCSSRVERSATPPSSRGGPVYLVPVGERRPPFIDELARHYTDKFGLRVVVLAPIAIEATAVDRYRGQLILEELLTLIRRGYPAEAADRTAVMVGITVHDAYIRGYRDWGWAFALRENNQFAMVSVARMDERNFGRPPNDELLKTRMRKMITKNLGIMYYGLASSMNTQSVLFGPILGVDDLDKIGEDF
jgi:predicted Zn-dependent protease